MTPQKDGIHLGRPDFVSCTGAWPDWDVELLLLVDKKGYPPRVCGPRRPTGQLPGRPPPQPAPSAEGVHREGEAGQHRGAGQQQLAGVQRQQRAAARPTVCLGSITGVTRGWLGSVGTTPMVVVPAGQQKKRKAGKSARVLQRRTESCWRSVSNVVRLESGLVEIDDRV